MSLWLIHRLDSNKHDTGLSWHQEKTNKKKLSSDLKQSGLQTQENHFGDAKNVTMKLKHLVVAVAGYWVLCAWGKKTSLWYVQVFWTVANNKNKGRKKTDIFTTINLTLEEKQNKTLK